MNYQKYIKEKQKQKRAEMIYRLGEVLVMVLMFVFGFCWFKFV